MTDAIPEPVRARDLVGYGRTPPSFAWPDGAQVVINPVLVYEEGSEYSVMWGDDRNDGWGEYADPGVQPPQRDPGTESHYEYGSRAGVWRLARIFDEAGVPVTVSAAAVALERGLADVTRRGDGSDRARHRDLPAGAGQQAGRLELAQLAEREHAQPA